MNDVFSASPCHECFPSLLIGRSRCWSPNQDGDHPGRACCRRCRSVFKESSSPGESVPPDTGGPGCEGVIDPGEGLQRPGGVSEASRGERTQRGAGGQQVPDNKPRNRIVFCFHRDNK